MGVPEHGIQGYVILFLFPIISYTLFRQYDIRSALVWTFIIGFLILPAAWVVQVDLPLIPPISKDTIPALSAAVFALLTLRHQIQLSQLRGDRPRIDPTTFVLPGIFPRSVTGNILIGMTVLAVVLSALTNRDPLIFEERVIPGHSPYDIFSMLMSTFVILLPLFLGRKFLADDKGHQLLLRALVISGLIYSLPALYEIRMSPQLNIMVYGFFQHQFDQHMRADGFRPIVFVDHGLVLGIFLASSSLAAATLIRTTRNLTRLLLACAVLYLLAVILLAKVFGALLILLLILPAAIFLPIRLQLLFALIIAVTTLLYPFLRGAGLVPVSQVSEFARSISPERAASLEFRLNFEDRLLEKANERPLFGWGSWGRNRLYNEAGDDISVTDGAWIIQIGRLGWVGYLAKFGLICLPIIFIGFLRKKLDVKHSTAGLCLVASAYLIDQIPNDSTTAIFWLISGALLGRLEKVAQVAEVDVVSHEAETRTRYSRFPPAHKRLE